MSTGLATTFSYLGRTQNEAALSVLNACLKTGDEEVRSHSIRALLRREVDLGFRKLVDSWEDMSDEERHLLADSDGRFPRFIAKILDDSKDAQWKVAAEMADVLSVYGSVPALIAKAERSADPRIRRQAVHSVLSLASRLGIAARDGLDRPGIRKQVVEQLAGSVKRFEFHQSTGLLDAFLSVVLWSDSFLQALIAEDSEHSDLLLIRLSESRTASVVNLLSGWIQRRRIPEVVVPILKDRNDEVFRSSLLNYVTTTPSATTLRNLRSLGSLKAIENSDSTFASLPSKQMPAMLHVLAAFGEDSQSLTKRAIDLIECGDDDAIQAACIVIQHQESPTQEAMIAEAIKLADYLECDRMDVIKESLVWRQIQLLEYPDDCVRATMLRSLELFTVPHLFQFAGYLSQKDLRKVGSIVRRVDATALTRIVDELKHPVLHRRINALDALVSLDLVDSVFDNLCDLLSREHLELRIKIAETLRWSKQTKARRLLNELSQSPSGPLRDAALESLNEMQRSLYA